MPAVVNLLPLPASGLPVHNPAPPPIHNNLPHSDRNAFTRRICTRCRRVMEYTWAYLEIAWAMLQDIWNATRRKFALSTWLAISISVIIGGLGLRYAFVQVVLSYETLMLAKWTARKDFWELCQEQEALEIRISANCELVLRTHFPDPPYIDLGRRSWKRTNRSTVPYEALDLEIAQHDNARLTHGVLLSALVVVLLLRNYRRIQRLSNTVLRGSALGNDRSVNRGQGSHHAEGASDTITVSQMSTGSERVPAETVRSRGLKKHPIIHQGGRAVNAGVGEDVISTESHETVVEIAEITLYSRDLRKYPNVYRQQRRVKAGFENVRSEMARAETSRSRGSKDFGIVSYTYP